MTILDGDIQLLKSEVLDDVPEGGGLATGISIVDGASNNLFPDVSELDRTYGRISLRKVFPAVVTDNTDTYYGSHVIVAEPPSDPKVSVSLFTTKSESDHRTDAQNALESYLSASAEGRWMLYGNHLVGQRTVQMHCAHSAGSPAVDDVLMLIANSDSSKYQYVRITRLISREDNVTFEDQNGSFTRDLITLEISDPLRYAFSASPMVRYTSDWYTPPSRIHTTIAADAASYFGVSPLKFSAALGDLTLKASSIYTQLVPSALAETPLVDTRCASDRTVIVPIAGAANVTFSRTLNASANVGAVSYFGHAIARGSLSITIGATTLTDDGSGGIVPTSGFTGVVDYEVGSVTLIRSTGLSNVAVGFSAKPACPVSAAGHTAGINVSVANRGYTYVKTLAPVPAPGTVIVSYMAQGKWYTLYDDSVGGISGDEGIGVGTINYATGAVVLTLGALPDADTKILFGWGSPAHYESHIGTSVFTLPSLKITLDGGALEPGSVSASYTSGGVTKTATDNGSGGFSGQGTGYIDYATGYMVLQPTTLPDSGTSVGMSYRKGGKYAEVFTATGSVNNFTLAHAVKPGTLSIIVIDASGLKHTLGDDGSGGLVLRSSTWTQASGSGLVTSVASATAVSGSINYSTGAVSLAVSVTVSQQYQTGFTWASSSSTANAVGAINATYRGASDTAGATQTATIPVTDLQVDILPSVSNTLVSGGVRFTLAGSVYVDRAGVLVRNPSNANNGGTPAGSINYATGVVTITQFDGGGSPALSVSALTRRGVWSDWQMTFRTAGAPLQSASLYVSATRADTSALVSGTAAPDGTVSGSLVLGTVDTTTGIVSVKFGQMVTAAGNESEWWYNAADIVAGQIFKPKMVFPDTAKYNAVAISSLPLSADILGLDPVRLPVDGRVPIFRKGNVAVVHHTATTTPAAATNGQTVNVGRVRLAKVRVVGNDGNTITAGYSADLDAGTVTFTNVSGYSQPVKIEHRIEDMALVADVQINGELRVTRPLTHDFPLGSFVSSALVIGDMHARVSTVFDQATWLGWSDTVQGSEATGTYNRAQYPLEVTNRGAISERWEIIFTNTTTVNVIGASVGQIATAMPISALIAPVNPATGTPYFSIDPRGWGSGWSAGNVLRINTVAAHYPVWCARTVLQGNSTINNDRFTLGVRGDVNS